MHDKFSPIEKDQLVEDASVTVHKLVVIDCRQHMRMSIPKSMVCSAVLEGMQLKLCAYLHICSHCWANIPAAHSEETL